MALHRFDGSLRERLRYDPSFEGVALSVYQRQDVWDVEGNLVYMIPVRFTDIRIEAINRLEPSITAHRDPVRAVTNDIA